MRYTILVAVIASIILFNWNTAWTESAEPGGERRGAGRHERHDEDQHDEGFRGEGRHGKRRGGSHGRAPHRGLLGLIDANRDGTLSANEIADAPAVLKQLDKNKDGEVTREELREHFRARMEGRGGDGPQGREGGDRVKRAERFLDHVMSHDANGDGQVDASELPDRMQRLLGHADADGDGAVDRSELESAAIKKREKHERHRRGRREESRPREGKNEE